MLDGAILLPRAWSARSVQDRKKAQLMGERWHEWAAQTAFVPVRARRSPIRGMFALVGGTILFFVATWLHPDAARASGAGSANLAR